MRTSVLTALFSAFECVPVSLERAMIFGSLVSAGRTGQMSVQCVDMPEGNRMEEEYRNRISPGNYRSISRGKASSLRQNRKVSYENFNEYRSESFMLKRSFTGFPAKAPTIVPPQQIRPSSWEYFRCTRGTYQPLAANPTGWTASSAFSASSACLLSPVTNCLHEKHNALETCRMSRERHRICRVWI